MSTLSLTKEFEFKGWSLIASYTSSGFDDIDDITNENEISISDYFTDERIDQAHDCFLKVMRDEAKNEYERQSSVHEDKQREAFVFRKHGVKAA